MTHNPDGDNCPACGWPDNAHRACDHHEAPLRADDPRYVGTFPMHNAHGLVTKLRASPHFRSDPMLRAIVESISHGDDPLRVVGEALVQYADEGARLRSLATRALEIAPLPPIKIAVPR